MDPSNDVLDGSVFVRVGAGIQEPTNDGRGNARANPTVVHEMLWLPPASSVKHGASCTLLDISGRKVLDLKPGANDVRKLAPGVYFVLAEPQATGHKPQTVRKIVLPE
jgi:hypothetical protein